MRGPCKWLENRRAFPLLVALIVLMLVPPLLDESKLTRTCFGLVMLATMFTAIYAMSEKRYFRLVVIFDSGYVLRYLVECLHELIFRHAAGVRFQHRFALHHFFDHASSLALHRQRRSRQNCRDNCRVPDSGDHLVSPVRNGRIPRSGFIHNGWRREYLRRWR